MYSVVDDFGFLGIVDPDAYSSFLQEHWSLEQLIEHLKTEMLAKRLLLWATGCEGDWNIGVGNQKSSIVGFRETTGPILVTDNRLCFVNWTSITGAASYEDVTLPRPKDIDLIITIPNGLYNCRIVQMFNPVFDPDGPEDDSDDQDEVNFHIEFEQGAATTPPWIDIPWSDVG